MSANAQSVVDTGFDTADGFVTGPINGDAPAAGAFDDVSLSSGDLQVTFSGGQQQQFFDGPSYQAGGTGFLFVNTGGGSAVFTGTSGNTITGGANNGDQNGAISFSQGVTEVSFFGADRANGAATTIDIFDTSGGLLLEDFEIESGSVGDQQFSFSSRELGGLIGEITFDLPGPAANPPYVAAIDTFSATRANTFDDSVNGFASSDGSAPTELDFSLGSNTVAGTVSVDPLVDNVRNFYTFTIEEGETLAAINLLEVIVEADPGENANGDPGFFALIEGSTGTVPETGFDNLGGALFSPSTVGTNLLDAISDGGISGGTGFESIGPGEFTFVIQQTGPEVSNFLIDFEVVPEPSTAALAGLGLLAMLRRCR
ncbi:MAG: PEP-CTERM sorting domain-containing protein [Planctomycetota bacterium]